MGTKAHFLPQSTQRRHKVHGVKFLNLNALFEKIISVLTFTNFLFYIKTVSFFFATEDAYHKGN